MPNSLLRPRVSEPIISNHHSDLMCEVSASAELSALSRAHVTYTYVGTHPDMRIMAVQSACDKNCPCCAGGLTCRNGCLQQAVGCYCLCRQHTGQQVRITGYLFRAPVRAACSFIDEAGISTPPLGLSNSWSQSWDVLYIPSGMWGYKALSRQIAMLVTHSHSRNFVSQALQAAKRILGIDNTHLCHLSAHCYCAWSPHTMLLIM